MPSRTWACLPVSSATVTRSRSSTVRVICLVTFTALSPYALISSASCSGVSWARSVQNRTASS